MSADASVWQHPWLRLQVAIRVMLETRWGEQWPTVKAELGKALALRERMRRARGGIDFVASYINRRRFLATVSASLLAAPLGVEAQSAGKPWRVGFVGAETLSTNRHWLDAFRLGMREQGYVEGQTLSIEDRWAEGRNERFRELGKALREWVRRLIVLSRRSA